MPRVGTDWLPAGAVVSCGAGLTAGPGWSTPSTRSTPPAAIRQRGVLVTMNPKVRNFFDIHRLIGYERPDPLILVNGLAEQSESWFANRRQLSRHFDVKVPEILVYDGDSLHRHIEAGGEVTVDYLADRLATYLDEFVQRPPYHLVGSSLGGQIVLTWPPATRTWSPSSS